MNIPPSLEDENFLHAVQNSKFFDIAIIGGGVAGLTAGLYAARDGFKTLVLEGTIVSSTESPGGALMLTSEIANYPGFNAAEGSELIETIRTQAENFDAIIFEERAEKIIFSEGKGKCHTINTNDNNSYKARAIIIATGAVAKRLNIPGEEEYYGKGVSSCATCDGFFFKNKIVAVAGGGDTAIEDALLLTRYAEKVHLIVRGTKLKATGPEAREIIHHPDVTIHWNTTIQKVNSKNNNVSGVILNNNEKIEELPVDGLFVAIGSNPATQFLQGTEVPMDNEGYILVNGASTAVLGLESKGIFAAGDVADKIYRQAITSAGKAAQAVLEARNYLTQ